MGMNAHGEVPFQENFLLARMRRYLAQLLVEVILDKVKKGDVVLFTDFIDEKFAIF